jgi:hypothetical protein
MNAKRYREGILIVDHRAGPGLSIEMTQAMGLPPMPGGKLMESATKKCAHCPRVVILNPDRSRPRHYCPSCDNYICDDCEAARVAAGFTCANYERFVDETLEAAVRAETAARQKL